MTGLDLWFNSHYHPPPHFHARRPGMWEIRIYFSTCTLRRVDYDLKWRRSPTGSELRMLVENAVRHRDALAKEWETKVCL